MQDSEVRPMTMTEIESLLASQETAVVIVALLSAALYGEDRRRVNELIRQRLGANDAQIVNAAILAVAHAARIDGVCNVQEIGPAFKSLAADERFRGRLRDALDDIEMFTSTSRLDFEMNQLQ
jgi:hypothetical protein